MLNENQSQKNHGVNIGHEFNEQRYGNFDTSNTTKESDKRIELVLKLAHDFYASNKKILDVGCTDGFLSREFKKIGYYTIGIDASETAIKTATLNCDEAYVSELGSKTIPIPDNSVDVIFAGEVIEHIFDTEFFIDDLKRVLKPGGHLIVSTPNLAAWINRISLLLGKQPFFTEVGVRPSHFGNPFRKISEPAGHIRNFTPSSLTHLISECGLKVSALHGASILSGKNIRKLDQFIAKFFPSFATDLVLVCTK